MNRALQLIVAVAFVHVLAACGQKGPLYLPQDKPEDNKTEQTDIVSKDAPAPTDTRVK